MKYFLCCLKSILTLIFLCFSFNTCADPFAIGDFDFGKKLHDESCSSCHNGMFPSGNGDELYSSDFRSISNSSKLRSQVEFCANQNNFIWFDEEIDSVSKFLNDNFYQFKE